MVALINYLIISPVDVRIKALSVRTWNPEKNDVNADHGDETTQSIPYLTIESKIK